MNRIPELIEIISDLCIRGKPFEKYVSETCTTTSGRILCVDDITAMHHAITTIQNGRIKSVAFCDVYTGEELSFSAWTPGSQYFVRFIQSGCWYEVLKAEHKRYAEQKQFSL